MHGCGFGFASRHRVWQLARQSQAVDQRSRRAVTAHATMGHRDSGGRNRRCAAELKKFLILFATPAPREAAPRALAHFTPRARGVPASVMARFNSRGTHACMHAD